MKVYVCWEGAPFEEEVVKVVDSVDKAQTWVAEPTKDKYIKRFYDEFEVE